MTVIPASSYFEKKKQTAERVDSLKQELSKLEAELDSKHNEYYNLVKNDDFAADDLFLVIEKLQKKVRSKKGRLETLEEILSKELFSHALEVMNSAKHVKDELSAPLKEKRSRVEEAKKEYFQALRDMQTVNDEYRNRMESYRRIWMDMGLDDINVQERAAKGIGFDEPASNLLNKYASRMYYLDPISSQFISEQQFENFKKNLSPYFVH